MKKAQSTLFTVLVELLLYCVAGIWVYDMDCFWLLLFGIGGYSAKSKNNKTKKVSGDRE